MLIQEHAYINKTYHAKSGQKDKKPVFGTI